MGEFDKFPGPPATPAWLVDKLLISEAGGPVNKVEIFTAEMRIGRAPDSIVYLSDPQVSRLHAIITRDGRGQYTVTDQGSRNGTFLDSTRLLPKRPYAWSGDAEVRIGPYRIRLERNVKLPAMDDERFAEEESLGDTTTMTPVLNEDEYDSKVLERKRWEHFRHGPVDETAPSDEQDKTPKARDTQTLNVAGSEAKPDAGGETAENPIARGGAVAPPPSISPAPAVMPAPSAPPGPQPIPPASPMPPQPKPTEAPPRGGVAPAISAADEQTQFAAYYPREVAPQVWVPMNAYIFRTSAAERVAEDAQRQLGGLISVMRRVVRAARNAVPTGTLLTATPYLPSFQFNPPSLTVGFFEDWHRLDFKMRATDAPLYQSSNGMLTFTVNGVIVADVPLSVYVGTGETIAENTLASQKLYDAIFCSYSREDTRIIERVERVYRVLGLDYLRDVHTLRSGQHWNDEIYALIDRADIFQLFWSATAAGSPYVEKEWRHALSLDRDRLGFIRPVYWQTPLPPVPADLGHIHFAYEPLLNE